MRLESPFGGLLAFALASAAVVVLAACDAGSSTPLTREPIKIILPCDHKLESSDWFDDLQVVWTIRPLRDGESLETRTMSRLEPKGSVTFIESTCRS
jgi:hypothetical protein